MQTANQYFFFQIQKYSTHVCGNTSYFYLTLDNDPRKSGKYLIYDMLPNSIISCRWQILIANQLDIHGRFW